MENETCGGGKWLTLCGCGIIVITMVGLLAYGYVSEKQKHEALKTQIAEVIKQQPQIEANSSLITPSGDTICNTQINLGSATNEDGNQFFVLWINGGTAFHAGVAIAPNVALALAETIQQRTKIDDATKLQEQRDIEGKPVNEAKEENDG